MELNGRTENSEMYTFFNCAEILQIDSFDHHAECDLILKKQSDSQRNPQEKKPIKLTYIGERTHLCPFLYQMATCKSKRLNK